MHTRKCMQLTFSSRCCVSLQADEIDIIMGSMAVGLCAGGGFCAGSSVAIAHQRINSAAYVFSASLPPLLAVAASEGLNYLAGLNSPNGQLPLATLPENIKTFRTILDKLDNIIYIPSSSISPLIHIYIRKIDGLTFYDQERLLQEIADECINNGVYINRTKKVWKQESVADLPSLRICISSGLTKKEVEKAANVIKVSELCVCPAIKSAYLSADVAFAFSSVAVRFDVKAGQRQEVDFVS